MIDMLFVVQIELLTSAIMKMLCRFALQIAMVQRSAVVNDKEDETLHEELSVKDDSDFYNPQDFYANVITLFSKLRKGDCVQVKGMLYYLS